MPEKNINKIIYGGQTLIDLTGDNISPEKMLKGTTGHMPDGSVKEGTCDFDMNTAEMNATADEILLSKKVGVKGKTVVGTMPDNAAVAGAISTKDGQYTVPRGFHDGAGKVGIAEDEKAKLLPENIRQGISVLGVEGSMSGTEGAKPQSKSVTPSTTEQQILPDSAQGYNFLSQVTVKAIPYAEVENAGGGLTATIG